MKTAQSFVKSMPEDTDLSWSVLDAQTLEEAKVYFLQSLVTCPEVPQKRQSLLSRQCCNTLMHSLQGRGVENQLVFEKSFTSEAVAQQ